jgi:hypothetical protein
MKQHYMRFQTGGQYEKIPFNRWVVLDFRHDSMAVREYRENFWHVCYSDNYSAVTVKRPDKPDFRITLQGDDIYPNDLLPLTGTVVD